MIDLDALKSELATSPWWIDGGMTNRDLDAAMAIIARHVAPVVTPDPPAEVRDVLAEAALEAAYYHSDGECWVDPSRIPEGDDPDDWTPELVQWEQANDSWRKNGYRIADESLAALREHGFAVVRTADVEARTCAGCRHWVQRKAYGRCAHLGCAWGEESPNAHGLSFSCAAWEAIR